MRISSALLAAALLAACGTRETADTNVLAQAEAAQGIAAAEDGRIACARGNAPFARSCTVEQTQGTDGTILTLRHPDGAFRRLKIATDGRGVVAADGAQPATVRIVAPGEIDVAIAGDRYRLPATVKADTARP